ncbi:fatty acid desaturase [Ochrobactrum sp. P20RRXII]|nr:hypothetical protein [Ochrobactrum sp. P20RRXII]NIH77440.1 fatty acid desaturase [Ochrobactrum sp. P20RRXII]
MKKTSPSKSSRKFSKWLLVINVSLAWGAVYMSIFYSQAEAVTAAALGLIGLLYTGYVGVGHLDFRKVLEMQIKSIFKGPGDVE